MCVSIRIYCFRLSSFGGRAPAAAARINERDFSHADRVNVLNVRALERQAKLDVRCFYQVEGKGEAGGGETNYYFYSYPHRLVMRVVKGLRLPLSPSQTDTRKERW